MSKQERFVLKGEDMKENFELSQYVAQSLVDELCRSFDKDAETSKAAEARQNGIFNFYSPINCSFLIFISFRTCQLEFVRQSSATAKMNTRLFDLKFTTSILLDTVSTSISQLQFTL
jgi:hypothetical protein